MFLVITALILSFGSLSTWRLRGQVAARHQLWQSRWPRDIQEPVPAWWQPGTVGTVETPPYDVLDHPAMNLPVARGPLPAAIVDWQLLDFTRGANQGVSQYTAAIPVTSQRATADITSTHPLFSGVWTYEGTKLAQNTQRRVPVLYELNKAPAELSQAYIDAVVAVYFAPYRPFLAPLDRELDFARFFWPTPDFHPPLGEFCGLDAAAVHDSVVARVIEQIAGVYTPQRRVAGVPETMTRTYLALYRGAISILEDQLSAQPPFPANVRAVIQAELNARHNELDPLIEQLEAFLATF